MGIIKAFSGSLSSTIADQWKEIIIPGAFDEYTAISPGFRKSGTTGGMGTQNQSNSVITNGSIIYVPENVAAFIFSKSGIEEVITEAGGYEYQKGQSSLLNGEDIDQSIFKQAKTRIGFGGLSPDHKQVAFINLREIRDIKFGTRGAQVYHDFFYETDLEIFAYGSFTIQVKNPDTFIKKFVPPNITYYSFSDYQVRSQILSEFLQSFTVVLNSLSNTYRISQLPSQANTISNMVAKDSTNAGTWGERFGFEIVKVSIENIEFTPDSRELVKQYSTNKMNMKAYDNVSQKTSNIAAQQKIAQGVLENGLGNVGGMIFSANTVQGLGPSAETNKTMSLDEQIELLKKLKNLVDAGILTDDEFNTKKKEIMDL
ncbi:SPFH domain-containing protein [Chryseomicrobium imtechense]